MKNTLLFSIAWVFAMFASIASAEGTWNKIHDKDGIRVMTRPFPGSSFLEFRGEMTVDYDLATITQFLWTTQDMCKWMDDCVSVEQKGGSDTDRTIYIVNAAPPPLSNRDVLIRNTLVQDANYTVRYTMDRLPETDQLKSGNVQIPKFKGVVELIPLGPRKTVIAYQAHFEAGGIVSGWMANILVKKNPLNTLENARDVMKKKAYTAHPSVRNFPG